MERERERDVGVGSGNPGVWLGGNRIKASPRWRWALGRQAGRQERRNGLGNWAINGRMNYLLARNTDALIRTVKRMFPRYYNS
jgi:hypothetical protein